MGDPTVAVDASEQLVGWRSPIRRRAPPSGLAAVEHVREGVSPPPERTTECRRCLGECSSVAAEGAMRP